MQAKPWPGLYLLHLIDYLHLIGYQMLSLHALYHNSTTILIIRHLHKINYSGGNPDLPTFSSFQKSCCSEFVLLAGVMASIKHKRV